MVNRDFGKIFFIAVLIMFGLCANSSFAVQTENYKTVDGMDIYLGILPAEIIAGHPKEHPESGMHGGTPSSINRYHLVVALFDKATGERITDAQVTATITEIGFAGETKKLEPMKIADTVTYGNYFKIENGNQYLIIIEVRRPNMPGVIKAQFSHEHFAK